MENPNRDPPRSKRTFRPNNNNNNNNNNHNHNSHASMSDNDSATDSWHSPFTSPFRLDEPQNENISNKNTKSLVSLAVDHYYSSVPSPGKSNFPATAPASAGLRPGRPWPHSEKLDYPSSGGNGGRGKKSALENHDSSAGIAAAPVPVVSGLNRLTREDQEVAMQENKVVADGGGGLEEGEMVLRLRRESSSSSKAGVWRAAVVFRVFAMAACLISFSVMAADKTRGWAGDSYDRYIEYRYCLVVNIIGFVYSGCQALGLACQVGTDTGNDHHQWRNFSLDQIVAYLLLSASSCAATRVTDWILNWGKDDFTLMATASIAMSFIAFVAFAFSSLISAYNLFNRSS